MQLNVFEAFVTLNYKGKIFEGKIMIVKSKNSKLKTIEEVTLLDSEWFF